MTEGGTIRGFAVATMFVAACRPDRPDGSEVLGAAARDSIVAAIRQESDRMLVTMRGRNADSVLAFYAPVTAYAGNGAIGDWPAIVAGTKPRYATYTKVDCRWGDPVRIDVVSRQAGILTAPLLCEKSDSGGKTWREDAVRTEVLAFDGGRWRIVAVHESTKPGGELR